jgi:threonylcarbamoyladenosine tRNA methylthiotransferase MtaB
MKKKYFISTLGCRVNQYESQAYSDQLEALGYEKASPSEAVDLCIVNTCSVTKQADQSSKIKISQLQKKFPKAKIFVTGCFEKQNSAFFSLSNNPNIVHISNLQKENLIDFVFPKDSFSQKPPFAIKTFLDHTRAFVKIQDGCDLFCSYCIVPYRRGPSRSREIPSILEEVKTLVANGYKEIVLTGINIGEFGKEFSIKNPFVALLDQLEEISLLETIRLSSINPDSINFPLMEKILHSKKIGNNLHISLQSGSDAVLKKMRRRYTADQFLSILHKMKEHSPDFTFSTDIIVGFPTESDQDFAQTLSVVKEAKFLKTHIFPYSKRENTLAAKYVQDTPLDELKRRKENLTLLCKEVSNAFKETFLKKKTSILLEKDSVKKRSHFGHTRNFLPVFLPMQKLSPNTNVKVRLDSFDDNGFYATYLGEDHGD